MNFLQVIGSKSSGFHQGPNYKPLVVIKLILISFQPNRHVLHPPLCPTSEALCCVSGQTDNTGMSPVLRDLINYKQNRMLKI